MLNIFGKHSILDVWQASKYAPGLFKLFFPGSQRDTQERWCICQTDYSIYFKLRILSLNEITTMKVLQWKCNIQASKRLMKNDYSVWWFWSFFHFLHCNVPDNKFYKQKWGVLIFTRIKLVGHVLACALAITRIK